MPRTRSVEHRLSHGERLERAHDPPQQHDEQARSLASFPRDKRGAQLQPQEPSDGADITFLSADFFRIKPHLDDPSAPINQLTVQRVLLDQGSSADIIYDGAFARLGVSEGNLAPYEGTLVGFASEQVWVKGALDLDTTFGEEENARTLRVKYLIFEAEGSYNMIIGRNTLNRLCAVISTAHLAVKYPLSNGHIGGIVVDQRVARECYCNAVDRYGKKNASVGHRCSEVETPKESLDPRGEGRVNRPTPIEETKELKFDEKILKIGTKLSEDQEQRLSKLLDIFAWSHKDMPGIDPNFICHKLALNPGAKPITQTRRRMGNEKEKAIQKEVNKLLAADFIREIKYPTWLANVVMVKKANEKWRMCVDYTDLNKACPKDSYPLPSIDKLVDGASGNELLSLMDAYSGYHQIKMHPLDEDKTTFMTARVNYCYQTMPFGLKNVGATYQWLIDRVFEGQVRRNMEVYVVDMIVKSVLGSNHHEDLMEAFDRIRKHNMRLNPEKCSFGIHGGKFLGIMITSRGIEINPNKCKAIQEMKSPSNVKEVQRLTGRTAALSRFLPHSGDKSAPFFKCLNKNMAFEWNSECEEAFTHLKEMLSTPPVLSKPVQGLPLHLYFSVGDHAISSVILQEVDGEQKIVYFVSHTHQGAQVRYQKIEKAALAVLITARRLRPYFQSFLIKIRTDLPLRQVLQKPDLSGRLVAWSVELSEYGLQYDKRGKVDAQTLADFVVELTPEKGEKVSTQWILFVDGSSNNNRSGAGVTLQGPGELVLEQSLRFQFKTSNNQAEYRALIAVLKLEIEVQIDNLLVRTDSLLVASQVNGEFQVKEPALIKYVERVRLLMGRLQQVVVEFVPRAQNQRADALAKLASTRKPGNNQIMIQETLAGPSIKGDLVASVDRQETWMNPIIDILAGEPSDVVKYSKAQRREAGHYTLLDGILFRRGFSSPLLRCLPPEKYEAVMTEVHEGVCASHIGGRLLVSKVLRAGFYWPTTRKDCAEFVRKCEKCQVFANLPRAPPEQLVTIRETPFRMTYEADAMLPVEIDNSSWRTAPRFEGENSSNMAVELDLLSETHNEARLRDAAMKQRAAAKYDTKVKPREMQVGDLVLKKRTGVTGNKLSPIWEGPYRILKALGRGAYHLESLDGKRVPRSWNAAKLKYYYS
ncbi:uncharacterized protein LOC130744188 [Lotus japonicus]|uniref:uncharacterized protein LOC130744188 n=1 Tax=Lotus japonicus TaxID=34305 RepID=UPI00258E0AA6|nr:uncharacterized protein LOC130744188 [Lotus japonicus]